MIIDIEWIPAELQEGIDSFIEEQDVPPNPRMSRQDALVVIVRDWLQGQG